MRFVASPEGEITPDAAARLPGRGIWVSATRAAVGRAVEKNLFARAARRNIRAGADLGDRAERALLSRIIGDLGLARRAGMLVFGFDNVARALDATKPPALLIAAADGAADGKRKLAGAAHGRGLRPVIVDFLTSAELGLAVGRGNVIHAAVQPGDLAKRLIVDTERLKGFRDLKPDERNR